MRLPSYGLAVACGYLAALLYINAKARTFCFDREKLHDLFFWTIIAGMAGAKVFYAAAFWDTFGATFAAKAVYLLKTFQYGFVFYGGLIFGAAAFCVKARADGLDLLRTADLCAPALALGQAFGRLGCFLAGCCHGRVTDSVFGVTFTNAACEINPALLNVKIHPSQLYEAAGDLAIFFILNTMLSKGGRGALAGRVAAAYALAYPALRFAAEFTRGDDRGGFILGLSPAQFISLLIFAAAALAAALFKARSHGK